jgi:hypothetical protein
MDEACIIVTKNVDDIEELEGKSYSSIKKFVNGKNKGQGWKDEGGYFWSSRNYSHLSALEAYICLNGAKNENIIKYLKGESDKLIL